MEPNDTTANRSRDALLRESKDRVAVQTIELCRTLRIRALAGGGPVLNAQGLISPIVATTASIVVDPASIWHLHAALRQRGWRPVPDTQRFRTLPAARLALTHDDEIGGLILYSVIPGFFADPEETFDVLWERHREVMVRGVNLPALGRMSSAILASHDGLDGRESRARSRFDYFVEQFRRIFDDRERAMILELVKRVGGCAEMGRVLEALDLVGCPFTLPSQSYVRWRLQVEGEQSDQVRSAVAFLELGPHGRRQLRESKRGRRPSIRRGWIALRSLPATSRAIFGAKRRWAASFG